jgi:hypothetical protein
MQGVDRALVCANMQYAKFEIERKKQILEKVEMVENMEVRAGRKGLSQ